MDWTILMLGKTKVAVVPMTVVVPEWYKTSWNLVKMIPNYMRLLLESK